MLASPIPEMLFEIAIEIASHVWVIVVLPRELSRTTSGEVAFSVQTTGLPRVLIVQFLRSVPSAEPKKRVLEEVVKEVTVEVKSGGLTSPKTATSRNGMEWSDWNKGEDLSGGIEAFVAALRTNETSALAVLTSGIDVRYCRTTWSKRLKVPYCRTSNWDDVGVYMTLGAAVNIGPWYRTTRGFASRVRTTACLAVPVWESRKGSRRRRTSKTP